MSVSMSKPKTTSKAWSLPGERVANSFVFCAVDFLMLKTLLVRNGISN